MKKRVVCLVLGVAMMLTQTMTVLATTESQIRQEKSQAENQLNDTYAAINNLSDQQAAVQANINALDADLVDLMIQIDATKADIANTEANIANKEAEITAKEAEIEETKAKLAIAEANRDKQYQDMKTRIRYVYESGGDAAWLQMLLDSEDIATLLNRAEYTKNMHANDREKWEQFVAVVTEVTDLKNMLESQRAELEAQKVELEAQKASLESQKADLEVQQADLQVRLDEQKAINSDYENQIAAARDQANQISNLIAQQEAELNRIAEERRQAEAAAAREAAAAAERQAVRSVSTDSSSDSSDSGSSDYDDSPSFSGGGSSGGEIVAYADQFIGYPYVWGGNSLTGGIDCSHFVYQVLKNCGVYSGGYYTSGGWRSQGRAVGSLSEARAGDVICYSGHVAIYDGNGGIVEAKGSKWGITHDRSADCKTILAIRRFT